MLLLLLLLAGAAAQCTLCGTAIRATTYLAAGCCKLCPAGNQCNGSSLTPCRPSVYEYQSQLGMPFCAVSQPCGNGAYQAASPTPTSAVVCNATRTCAAPAEIQTAAPTITTDRRCSCADTYVRAPDTTVCVSCATAIPFCYACNSTRACTQCWPGQTVSSIGTCVTCQVEHCNVCDGAGTACVQCEAGRIGATCACRQGSLCSACNTTHCSACAYGSVLVAGRCAWRACNSTSSTGCTVCNVSAGRGTALSGHCAPTQCAVFDAAADACRVCTAPTVLSDGACVETNCTAAGTCVRCDPDTNCQPALSAGATSWRVGLAIVGVVVAMLAVVVVFIVRIVRRRQRQTGAPLPPPLPPPRRHTPFAEQPEDAYMMPTYDSLTMPTGGDDAVYDLASSDGYIDVDDTTESSGH